MGLLHPVSFCKPRLPPSAAACEPPRAIKLSSTSGLQKAADLPIAIEKGGLRRRGGGGGGGGMRLGLVLLAGAALVMMVLQFKPPNSSLLDQLNVPHNTDVAAWALASDGGLQLHARNMWQGDSAAPALGEQYLSFDVCGDPAHQRVALLSGEQCEGRAANMVGPGRQRRACCRKRQLATLACNACVLQLAASMLTEGFWLFTA